MLVDGGTSAEVEEKGCVMFVESRRTKVSPYKRLAEAVLIQAIKDATRHHGSLQANHFLLSDKDMFEFWCDLAELAPEVVREKLSFKLNLRSTYKVIRRSKDRYTDDEAA